MYSLSLVAFIAACLWTRMEVMLCTNKSAKKVFATIGVLRHIHSEFIMARIIVSLSSFEAGADDSEVGGRFSSSLPKVLALSSWSGLRLMEDLLRR